MVEYKEEQIITIERTPKNFKCNLCGKGYILKGNDYVDLMNTQKYQHFNIPFGEGSKFANQVWDLHICDNCLEKMKNNAVIKPTILELDAVEGWVDITDRATSVAEVESES